MRILGPAGRTTVGIVTAWIAAACAAPPTGPADGTAGRLAVAAIADGLALVDLDGRAPPRLLLPGGGWRGAVWVGCTSFVALDRRLDRQRSLSVLDTEHGRLYPVELPSLADLVVDPDVLDALVAAFGAEDAFPENRLEFGELRSDAGGRPALELIARASLPGEEERSDLFLRLEPLALPAPVERAVAEAPACAPAAPRWVFRSAHGAAVLGGAPADDWSCRRFAGQEIPVPAAATPASNAVVGRTTDAGEEPLRVPVPGLGDVTLPDSAPVDAYERCDAPDGRWIAVRVEQPGLNGFDALYAVRTADGRVECIAPFDVTERTASGIAVLGPDTLLFGSPDRGWFVWRAQGDPQRLGDFPPPLRP